MAAIMDGLSVRKTNRGVKKTERGPCIFVGMTGAEGGFSGEARACWEKRIGSRK